MKSFIKNIFANSAASRTMTALFFAGILGASLFVPNISHAQSTSANSLTITPPFFTLNVSPGDTWSSSIRVVNANPGDLPVEAIVKGFEQSDDEGHGTFIDLSTIANDPDALANWITVSSPSVDIPSGSAVDIPFTIFVPKDASPGGHYAAILIGTQPGSNSGGGSFVGVSSYISALIFVRVSGNVQEAGNITEFSTDKSFYSDPNVNFTVRFANTGNVQLRPVGEIEIYNMFGKEQGSLLINQTGDLGYVLTSSTRRFDLNWQGPASLLDLGEYTAIVTLAYGTDGTKSVSETLTFWVIPWQRILEDLLILALIIGTFVYFLRRYIKKMLAREMAHSVGFPPRPPMTREERPAHIVKKHEEKRPSDTVDLRKKMRDE